MEKKNRTYIWHLQTSLENIKRSHLPKPKGWRSGTGREVWSSGTKCWKATGFTNLPELAIMI